MENRKPIKLEGQQDTAEKAFKSRCKNVERLSTRLAVLMLDASVNFDLTPTHWTHAGSMAHVEELLTEAVNFLSNGEGVEK